MFEKTRQRRHLLQSDGLFQKCSFSIGANFSVQLGFVEESINGELEVLADCIDCFHFLISLLKLKGFIFYNCFSP